MKHEYQDTYGVLVVEWLEDQDFIARANKGSYGAQDT